MNKCSFIAHIQSCKLDVSRYHKATKSVPVLPPKHYTILFIALSSWTFQTHVLNIQVKNVYSLTYGTFDSGRYQEKSSLAMFFVISLKQYPHGKELLLLNGLNVAILCRCFDDCNGISDFIVNLKIIHETTSSRVYHEE